MIDLRPDDLAVVAASFPPDVPLFMVNLLRFRDHAHHSQASDLEPCTGREAYFQRYLPAFARTVEPFGWRTCSSAAPSRPV